MDFLIPYSLDIALSALIIVLITCDTALDVEEKSNLWGVAGLGLLLILGGSFLLEPTVAGPGALWALDSFALFFKRFFLLIGLFGMLAVRTYAVRFRHGEGEYYSLVLFALLGGTILASVQDWITLFVGLELMTVTLFVLVTWARKDGKCLEAGMKYVIVGTFSSAFLLYGIAYLYGMSGTLRFGELQQYILANQYTLSPGVYFGALLVIAGLAFKMAAFPFHVWAPDVYEGAPTPTTAVLGVASKGAGFVMAMRLLVGVMAPLTSSLVLRGYPSVSLIAIMAALTIAYGSLAAIPQWNIKRLMGYSSISHAGYLLIGLAVTGAAAKAGAAAICYYLLAYLFTNFGLFLVLCAVDRYSSDYEIDSLAGLGRRSPLLGITMTFSLLSLAGIPPFAGFFGKLLLLLAAFQGRIYWLAFIAMVMVVVGMYVYLSVLKRIYAMEPVDDEPIEVDGWTALGCYMACGGMLIMGVFPAPFLRAAEAAALCLF